MGFGLNADLADRLWGIAAIHSLQVQGLGPEHPPDEPPSLRLYRHRQTDCLRVTTRQTA
jgi:hypothetical protein